MKFQLSSVFSAPNALLLLAVAGCLLPVAVDASKSKKHKKGSNANGKGNAQNAVAAVASLTAPAVPVASNAGGSGAKSTTDNPGQSKKSTLPNTPGVKTNAGKTDLDVNAVNQALDNVVNGVDTKNSSAGSSSTADKSERDKLFEGVVQRIIDVRSFLPPFLQVLLFMYDPHPLCNISSVGAECVSYSAGNHLHISLGSVILSRVVAIYESIIDHKFIVDNLYKNDELQKSYKDLKTQIKEAFEALKKSDAATPTDNNSSSSAATTAPSQNVKALGDSTNAFMKVPSVDDILLNHLNAITARLENWVNIFGFKFAYPLYNEAYLHHDKDIKAMFASLEGHKHIDIFSAFFGDFAATYANAKKIISDNCLDWGKSSNPSAIFDLFADGFKTLYDDFLEQAKLLKTLLHVETGSKLEDAIDKAIVAIQKKHGTASLDMFIGMAKKNPQAIYNLSPKASEAQKAAASSATTTTTTTTTTGTVSTQNQGSNAGLNGAVKEGPFKPKELTDAEKEAERKRLADEEKRKVEKERRRKEAGEKREQAKKREEEERKEVQAKENTRQAELKTLLEAQDAKIKEEERVERAKEDERRAKERLERQKKKELEKAVASEKYQPKQKKQAQEIAEQKKREREEEEKRKREEKKSKTDRRKKGKEVVEEDIESSSSSTASAVLALASSSTTTKAAPSKVIPFSISRSNFSATAGKDAIADKFINFFKLGGLFEGDVEMTIKHRFINDFIAGLDAKLAKVMPARFNVYGSTFYGTNFRSSDVDILVILPYAAAQKWKQTLQADDELLQSTKRNQPDSLPTTVLKFMQEPASAVVHDLGLVLESVEYVDATVPIVSLVISNNDVDQSMLMDFHIDIGLALLPTELEPLMDSNYEAFKVEECEHRIRNDLVIPVVARDKLQLTQLAVTNTLVSKIQETSKTPQQMSPAELNHTLMSLEGAMSTQNILACFPNVFSPQKEVRGKAIQEFVVFKFLVKFVKVWASIRGLYKTKSNQTGLSGIPVALMCIDLLKRYPMFNTEGTRQYSLMQHTRLFFEHFSEAFEHGTTLDVVVHIDGFKREKIDDVSSLLSAKKFDAPPALFSMFIKNVTYRGLNLFRNFFPESAAALMRSEMAQAKQHLDDVMDINKGVALDFKPRLTLPDEFVIEVRGGKVVRKTTSHMTRYLHVVAESKEAVDKAMRAISWSFGTHLTYLLEGTYYLLFKGSPDKPALYGAHKYYVAIAEPTSTEAVPAGGLFESVVGVRLFKRDGSEFGKHEKAAIVDLFDKNYVPYVQFKLLCPELDTSSPGTSPSAKADSPIVSPVNLLSTGAKSMSPTKTSSSDKDKVSPMNAPSSEPAAMSPKNVASTSLSSSSVALKAQSEAFVPKFKYFATVVVSGADKFDETDRKRVAATLHKLRDADSSTRTKLSSVFTPFHHKSYSKNAAATASPTVPNTPVPKVKTAASPTNATTFHDRRSTYTGHRSDSSHALPRFPPASAPVPYRPAEEASMGDARRSAFAHGRTTSMYSMPMYHHAHHYPPHASAYQASFYVNRPVMNYNGDTFYHGGAAAPTYGHFGTEMNSERDDEHEAEDEAADSFESDNDDDYKRPVSDKRRLLTKTNTVAYFPTSFRSGVFNVNDVENTATFKTSSNSSVAASEEPAVILESPTISQTTVIPSPETSPTNPYAAHFGGSSSPSNRPGIYSSGGSPSSSSSSSSSTTTTPTRQSPTAFAPQGGNSPNSGGNSSPNKVGHFQVPKPNNNEQQHNF